MGLIKESKRYHDTADKILKSTGLLDLLSRYGEVKPIGAYSYDLMLSGDIDIHVYSDNHCKQKAVEILNQLISIGKFQKVEIDDLVSFPKFKDLPNGYYIGLRIPVDGFVERWRVDIWFLASGDLSSMKHYEIFKQGIKPDQKKIIMELKQYKKDNNLKFPSTVIYDAVMEEGIKSLEEFKKKIV